MLRMIAVFALSLAFLALSFGSSAAGLTVTANHSLIKVNYDYNGSSVSLRGIADPDVELVATISSEEAHQTLKRKDKVAGFLWMNVEDVSFEHLPNVYLLRSSKPPKDILSPEELEKYSIGYGALREKAAIEAATDASGGGGLFGEFVKFKENSRLYSSSVGGFSFTDDEDGRKYYTKMDWPYQIPPGRYLVDVYAVRGGRVVEKAETDVVVERAGIIERLADMAQNNGAAYGAIAIVIALGAGFGVGLIFRKSGGTH